MITSNMSLSKVAAAARKDVGQVQRHVLGKHPDFWERFSHAAQDELVLATGCFTSDKELQWVYALTAAKGRVTLYPMLWYLTRKGVNAMQIDDLGPASYFQPHVMDRYVERFRKKGDPTAGMLAFQHRNYEKSCHPIEYNGDPDQFVAVLDDGYAAGAYLGDDAIVRYRTFYDMDMGRKRFGQFRTGLEWSRRLQVLGMERTGRRNTPHHVWSRGYRVRVELRKTA